MKRLVLIPALALLLAACSYETPDTMADKSSAVADQAYQDGYDAGAASVKCPGPAPAVKRQVVPPKKKVVAKRPRVKEAWEICLDAGHNWIGKRCIRIPKPTDAPVKAPANIQAP